MAARRTNCYGHCRTAFSASPKAVHASQPHHRWARAQACLLNTQATAPRAPLFVASSALRALLAQLELEHLYSILCLQGSRSTSPLSGFACHEGILPSMQTARAGLRIFLVSCDASVLLSILWCCQSIFLRRSSMSRPRRPFNQRSSCLS